MSGRAGGPGSQLQHRGVRTRRVVPRAGAPAAAGEERSGQEAKRREVKASETALGKSERVRVQRSLLGGRVAVRRRSRNWRKRERATARERSIRRPALNNVGNPRRVPGLIRGMYYCQNQHADLVALITAAGGQREMDRYSAYGVPFGLPEGDSDSNGLANATDRTIIQGWINTSAYDVRGDVDLDGDVQKAGIKLVGGLASVARELTTRATTEVIAETGEAAVALTAKQAASYDRFVGKVPVNCDSFAVDSLGDGVIFTASSPARHVPGSKAVYQKVVDKDGVTTAYEKTTFDAEGNVIHVKSKLIK